MARREQLPRGMRKIGNVYYADFMHEGARFRKRLSADRRTAAAMLTQLRARAEKGEHGLVDNHYSLKELSAEFLKSCRQTIKPATWTRYRDAIGRILANLPARTVAAVTLREIENYREDRLKEGVSPRTVNLELQAFGTMLRWAVRRRLIGSNPLAELRPLRHDRPREGRALSTEEVNRLLAASREPWRSLWYGYLTTGARLSELVSLRFSDIDWQAREIVLRADRTKNGRERRIPVDDALYAILERQAAGRDARRPGTAQSPALADRVRERFSRDHVFVSTQNTPLDNRSRVLRAFKDCCHRANIETLRLDADGREVDHVDLHSLRRTFATALIEGGADPKSVQTLLGHRTLDMTMRLYTKLRAGTTRQAIGRLAYGAGVRTPEHLVQFANAGENCQRIPQSFSRAEAS